ncbi:hypothetical protein Tco_1164032 [Tanacetum coccineum]
MAIVISSIHPTEVQPTHDQPITLVISHPKSSHATLRIDKGKGIATESDEDPLKRWVPTSTIIHPDLDELVRVEFMINGNIIYLTEQEIQEYWDKKEKMKKAAEEEKLLAISKPEVIKVVIKPEPITDVRIHPNTKPTVASVFRNNDKRNFEVHQPFKFPDFGITELDELGPIIQNKKISVVKDLMTSLSKRYERLKKIPKELRIQSALPAPVLEQTSSQTSGRKRKHMELEPKVKVPGLECSRSLPEGIPFVNHMVIEEPGYGIFFIDVFGNQAFQRWDDIHKVRIESLVSYLVMASMVKTEENARFSLKLRNLIADHLDQENLKSKKMKL